MRSYDVGEDSRGISLDALRVLDSHFGCGSCGRSVYVDWG